MKWNYDKIKNFTSKVGSGATPKGGEASYKASGTPLIRSQNVHFGGLRTEGIVYLDNQQAAKLDNVRVEPDDVLLNITGASIGRVCLAPLEMEGARVNQHVCIIRPEPGTVLPRFLELFLSAPEIQDFIQETESGATREALTKGKVLEFGVPIPSLEQQALIVSIATSQLERVFKVEKLLKAALALLERFRQSVLASAFRGDLTAEWREQNPDVEPASELLERIRVERKRLWIEDYARKLADRAQASAQKKNKAFTDEDWQTYYDKKLKVGASKYEEPEPVDAVAEGLPELPPTWEWVRLPMCGELSRGKSTHRPRNDLAIFGDQYPFIQTGEVANSPGYITDASTYYNQRGLEQSRLFPIGTVCITIAANIADSAVLAIPCCFPDSVVGLISIEGMVVPEYAEFFIRTARADLSQYSARATAQKNINISILNNVFIPLAPYREARELVARVKQRMEAVERLTQAHGEVQSELGRLRHSVLASAFSNGMDTRL